MSYIASLEAVLPNSDISRALFTDLRRIGRDLRNVCMAAEDDEGDETMRDEVDASGGAMGDGDDGGDGNGGDDGDDDDDDDDKDDDDKDDDDPEFDWTGLEENVPYVSGVRSVCRSFYADHPCVFLAPSVFYVTRDRFLVPVSKENLSGFVAKLVISARRSARLCNGRRRLLAPVPLILSEGAPFEKWVLLRR